MHPYGIAFKYRHETCVILFNAIIGICNNFLVVVYSI
jgi:hypothetical protein